MDRCPRKDDALALGQQIPQMLLVTALIRRLRQGHHLLGDLWAGGMRRPASAVAVGEGGRALLSRRGQDPSHLSVRQAQARGGLRHRRVPSHYRIEHQQALLFCPAQRNARFHKRTFSLNTYPGHNH